MEHQNKYPLVFVHGMFGWGGDEGLNSKIPYWGATTGDLMQYLSENGCECYSTSSGPVSSAWDRACEIYARLTGTKVDYGKVHSETYRHRRFGRTYAEPLFEGWSPEKKIHLIGHSHGGLTVRMLAHLLTYGSKEEREGTDEGDLSPLFEGGHEDLIKSVTAICAPHNGALAYTFAKKYKLVAPLKFVAFNYIGIMGRSKAEGSIFDFHLEQFGLSDTPGMQDAFPIRRAKKILLNSRDNVEFDLSPEGAKINNEMMEISPNIYYFSYACSMSYQDEDGAWVADTNGMEPLFVNSAKLIVKYTGVTPEGTVLDESWQENDGLVNTISAKAPFNAPQKEYEAGSVEPGEWNIMPVYHGDHMSLQGGLLMTNNVRPFYIEHITMINSL